MFTGTLGTPQSQPGQVQLGYFCRGFAVWTGPFQLPSVLQSGALLPGGSSTLVIAPSVASQLALSDGNWWVFH